MREIREQGENSSSNAPCPMPHAPCPMPHAQCPIKTKLEHVFSVRLRKLLPKL
ncbi:hypothetical protein [Nostoc sp.]|uniref:hypothetical protein n=1 Tax=Nostoc sp. TaxID=1180 RepID=UPI002FF95F15